MDPWVFLGKKLEKGSHVGPCVHMAWMGWSRAAIYTQGKTPSLCSTLFSSLLPPPPPWHCIHIKGSTPVWTLYFRHFGDFPSWWCAFLEWINTVTTKVSQGTCFYEDIDWPSSRSLSTHLQLNASNVPTSVLSKCSQVQPL